MLKILSLTLSVVGTVFIVILVTGYLVNEEYKGEKQMLVDYEPLHVMKILTEFNNMEEGKRDVKSMELTGKYLGLYAWKENLKNGGFRRYRQIEKTENKIVVEMTESTYGVTGTWEFKINREVGRTKITIREDSICKNILRRGLLFYLGRDKETTDWMKFIRVRLFKRLLTTP